MLENVQPRLAALMRSTSCSNAGMLSGRIPFILETESLALTASFPHPQLHSPDFAADGFGQLGDEFDLPRVFAGCGHAFAVVRQFRGERGARRGPLAERDESFDDRAALNPMPWAAHAIAPKDNSRARADG